jgi:HNH endonuclease
MQNDLSNKRVKRFWAKVSSSGAGCWEWTGNKDRLGYGMLFFNNRKNKAHRFAYELAFGPIPEDLVIDHMCVNSSCVNPYHLDAVTQSTNMIRHGARRTHCGRGHARVRENLIGKLNPRCRLCKSVWRKERRQILKAQGKNPRGRV